MKIPCELIVWYVLPTIRRELARELVSTHGMTQAEVARRFGVTDAAVSQYLKRKRGTNPDIENSPSYHEFLSQVSQAADRIATGADIVNETCAVCSMVRRSGMLASIYESQTGFEPPDCVCPTRP